MSCRACKSETDPDQSLCIYCGIWENRARSNRDRNQVRVDGKLYVILHERRDTRFAEDAMLYAHHIEFKNKNKSFTTNLAYCGIIPDYFKSRLPDNAKFIELPIPRGKRNDN
jgi:galactose-1-phosphate uridylyltransferase